MMPKWEKKLPGSFDLQNMQNPFMPSTPALTRLQ